jgi:uncharacterized membrane protein
MDPKSSPGRLRIYSDGVFAIIMTVLVLDACRLPVSPCQRNLQIKTLNTDY